MSSDFLKSDIFRRMTENKDVRIFLSIGSRKKIRYSLFTVKEADKNEKFEDD